MSRPSVRSAEPDALLPVLSSLSQRLRTSNYRVSAVLPRPGDLRHVFSEIATWFRYRQGGHGGHTYSLFAPLYYRALARKAPIPVLLFRFFCLGSHEQAEVIEAALGGELFLSLLDSELITRQGAKVKSRIWATPYGSTLCFHDPHTVAADERREFVWLGGCSIHLADFVTREFSGRRFHRALDLCSGSGFQALCVAGRCDQVIATDVNERALQFGELNGFCNQAANVSFMKSDLFGAVEGTFDLIMANTPFVLMEEGASDTSGNGGKYGMEIAVRLFEQLDEHLGANGVAVVLASSAIVEGRNLLAEKLEGIFAGLDYRIELWPLYEYYGIKHHRAYETQGVQRCILYMVSLARTVAATSVTVHELGLLKRLLYRGKIFAIRTLARRGLLSG